MKTILLTALALVLLVLSSCAAQKLGVRHLDNLIEYRINSKLDLYASQKKNLESDVTQFLEGQKAYAENLKTLIRQVDPKRPEQFGELWQKFIEEYRRTALAFFQLLSKHLAALDNHQRAVLFSKQKEMLEEMQQRVADDGPEKLEKAVRKMFGKTSLAQLAVINRFYPHWKNRSLSRVIRQDKLHQKLTSILKQNLSGTEKERLLMIAFSDHLRESFQNQDPVIGFFQDIAHDLSAEQLKQFKKRKKEALELVDLFVKTKY